MKLSQEEVLKIARLARLKLSPEEVDKYSHQLSAILEYVEKLKTLNVDGIEPTAHAMTVPTPFRKDTEIQNNAIEKTIANAPGREDREGNFFKVPRVIQ